MRAGTVPAPYLNYTSVDINVTYLVSPASLLPPFGGPSRPECQQLSDSMDILGYKVTRAAPADEFAERRTLTLAVHASVRGPDDPMASRGCSLQ